MTINLYAYLESAPSFDEISASFALFGLVYRHTLPADERWDYPMHVFARADLRVVYHAGDPLLGESVLDSSTASDDARALDMLQSVLVQMVQRYGGTICDPRAMRRGAVF